MSNMDDHRWDLHDDDAFDRKMEEWAARDWPDWLTRNLIFPFTVSREEDEDDAYFAPGAAKAPFRLGHKMEVLEVAEEDVDQGVMVKVREKGQIGYVPLADLEVKPKTNQNFWPVREYVVWFANRY